MNLFEGYKPIEADKRKKKALSNKILKEFKYPQKRKPSHLRIQLSIAVAAVLLFIVGLGFFAERTVAPPSSAEPGDVSETQPDDKNVITGKFPDVTATHLTFYGESKHWEAVNKVYFRQVWSSKGQKGFKDGAFWLSYKGELPAKKGKFELDIKGSRSSSDVGARPFPENGVYQKRWAYAGYKSDEIKVTVQWNGKNETFKMTSQKEAFRKKTIAKKPKLSSVLPYGDYPLIGIAGQGRFQLAASTPDWGEFQKLLSTHFGDIGEGTKIPALLSANGDSLSQSLFFLLSGVSPSDDIQVIGTHNGKKKIFLTDPENSRILKEHFGSEIAIPAVLQFEEEGVWKLAAYANEKKVGSVTIEVYQNPMIHKATSSIIEGNTLIAVAAKITGDWSQKDGIISLGIHPTLQIETKERLFKNMPISNPFPIVVMGTPISGGNPFVQTFDKSGVSKHDGKYVFETTLPIEEEGKWNLTVFVGQYPMGNVTFFVR